MKSRKDLGIALKELLANHEEKPSENVWEHIEYKLKKKKKRKLILYFIIGNILITSFVIFYTFNKNKGNQINEKKNTSVDYLKIESSKSTNKSFFKKNTNKKENISFINFLHINEAADKQKTIAKNNLQKKQIEKEKQNKRLVNEKPITEKQVVLNKSETDNIKKPQKKIEEKKKKNKDSLDSKPSKNWKIYPNASLVYYNSMNKSFKKNITINYGFLLAYDLTNKMTIRTGVNKTSMNYSLESNIDNEKITYFEIPIETKYTFTKNKIKPSIIAGASYLFLLKGNNTNRNTISENKEKPFNSSFPSINLGLGVQTTIYKNIDFNLESMFKQHINSFNTNINFSPYTFSVTGGFVFKFN